MRSDRNRYIAERTVLTFYILRHLLGGAVFVYLIVLAARARDMRFTLLMVALTTFYIGATGFFIYRAVRRYRARYHR